MRRERVAAYASKHVLAHVLRRAAGKMVTASVPLRPTTADAPAGGGKTTTWAAPDHIAGTGVSANELLEAMPDGVVIVDGSGVIRAVNAVAESMFGYDRAELVGRPVQDLVPVLARAVHPARVQQYLAHPTDRPMGEGMELSGLRKDGSEFPIDVSLAPLESAQGRFVCASVRDVTYSRLAAIVDSSTDAQLDGTVTSWNTGAEHLYGYGAAEMVGHDHSAITPAGLRGELPAALQRISDRGRVAHYVTQRLCKDGTGLDVSITVSPVRNHSGVVIGYRQWRATSPTISGTKLSWPTRASCS
jgi:PAS domain S-box-containing protein